VFNQLRGAEVVVRDCVGEAVRLEGCAAVCDGHESPVVDEPESL
jgi:hypothetical protein